MVDLIEQQLAGWSRNMELEELKFLLIIPKQMEK